MMKSETLDAVPAPSNKGAGGGRMRRLVRFCRWAALNGALAWCAWLGVHGNEGAGRVLSFAAWIFAVLAQFGALNDEVKALAQKKGRSIPAWLSHGLGIAMMVFLVWHGWWWTAIAYLLIEIGEAATFHKPNAQALTPSENQKGNDNE